ncbi:hypothetical protein JVT61DRAFT_7689 [Boletus reticuloceps]|uniref:Uncharacterized protein n=1 Tax=Boletus reticuloceps TaxID=495285 RepID=A0A8I3A715_9AGAM|nr:hypothetical protein JVT61DRAFT_7689 [Boletus reticuloceps]
MKSAVASGCHHISFSDSSLAPCGRLRVRFPRTLDPSVNNLEVFWTDTHLAFSPNLISFTASVLRFSPLRNISLHNTGLTRSAWNKLLSSLTLPHLTSLALDCTCPLKTTLEFLKHHPSLDKLSLIPCAKLTHTPVSLPVLFHLAGPPGYLSALAKHLQNPGVVRILGVTLTDASSALPLISQVLSTTQHFENISRLKITLRLSGSTSPEKTYDVPDDEKRICRVSDLEIARESSDSGNIDSLDVSHISSISSIKVNIHSATCGTWLRAFPIARKVKLISNSLLNEQQLHEDFIRYAPSHQMFLSVGRLF